MQNKKVWYQSKTIIINALAGALVVLEAKTSLLQPLLPVNFYAAIAVALPVVNAFLRAITTMGISAGKN